VGNSKGEAWTETHFLSKNLIDLVSQHLGVLKENAFASGFFFLSRPLPWLLIV
jgi:hypothetical protein